MGNLQTIFLVAFHGNSNPMDDSSGPKTVSPWYRRLALYFLILFALLWSTLTRSSLSPPRFGRPFGVLSLNGSGFTLPSFNTTSQGPMSGKTLPASGFNFTKAIRIFSFIFGASFFFFFLLALSLETTMGRPALSQPLQPYR